MENNTKLKKPSEARRGTDCTSEGRCHKSEGWLTGLRESLTLTRGGVTTPKIGLQLRGKRRQDRGEGITVIHLGEFVGILSLLYFPLRVMPHDYNRMTTKQLHNQPQHDNLISYQL